MPLADIAALLRRMDLDRRTKLQVLGILAAAPGDKAVEDVRTLLRAFEEAASRERELLLGRLEAIEREYQTAVAASAAGLDRDIRTAQDDVNRSDEIERIRKSLQ